MHRKGEQRRWTPDGCKRIILFYTLQAPGGKTEQNWHLHIYLSSSVTSSLHSLNPAPPGLQIKLLVPSTLSWSTSPLCLPAPPMSRLTMWSALKPESPPVQALSRSPIVQFQHQLSSALQPSRAILLSAIFHTRSSARVSSQHELFRALSLESAQCLLAELICPQGSAFLLLLFIGPESDHWECLSVTDSLTDSLTHSCLVNLINVSLACEDGNSKLVEVS